MTKYKKAIRRVVKRFNNRNKKRIFSLSSLVMFTLFSASIAVAEPASDLPKPANDIHIKLVEGSQQPITGFSEPVINIKVVESQDEFTVRQRREEDAKRQSAEAAERESREKYSRTLASRSVPERFDNGGDAQAIAKRRVAEIWGEDQWPAFQALIQRESGWVVGNRNKSSGACGLAQAYPCSKLGGAYGNAEGEVEWAINYVSRRYGTPASANSFQATRGWY